MEPPKNHGDPHQLKSPCSRRLEVVCVWLIIHWFMPLERNEASPSCLPAYLCTGQVCLILPAACDHSRGLVHANRLTLAAGPFITRRLCELSRTVWTHTACVTAPPGAKVSRRCVGSPIHELCSKAKPTWTIFSS